MPEPEPQSDHRMKRVLDECEKIRATGLLRPKQLVEYARANTDSELHKHFEWDDTAAGEQWRLEQARRLIIQVKVSFAEAPEPLRYYVSLSTDRVHADGYRATPEVLTNPVHRAVLLEDALRELDSVRARYRQLTELAAIWRALDDARDDGPEE